MPRGDFECSDRNEAFNRILEAARKGECLSCEGTDARGAFFVEAEQWNHHCLGVPSVRQLQLASDSERLGAAVFHYIWLFARRGYRHNRTEWVRQIPNASVMNEFGISVSEFSAGKSVRRPSRQRKKARGRLNPAEQWISLGLLLA